MCFCWKKIWILMLELPKCLLNSLFEAQALVSSIENHHSLGYSICMFTYTIPLQEVKGRGFLLVSTVIAS
jgi:hypothetical protein